MSEATSRLREHVGDPAARARLIPHDTYTNGPSSVHVRFLDSHPAFQKRRKIPTKSPSTPSLYSRPERNSSNSTLRPRDSQRFYRAAESRPRYLTDEYHEFTRSALRIRPPSPESPQSSFLQSPDSEGSGSSLPPSRPRHIPIASGVPQPETHDFIIFPPTPAASADNTPRASLRSPYSCEEFIKSMSRPTTSGSRASTMDSSASAFSPEQSQDDRAKPAASSYLADVNSSDSSINQGVQETSSHVEAANGARDGEQASNSAASSPQLGGQAAPAQGPPTNLSGLMCNVLQCTGRGPHGLVGATTTIIGDKLYVFGGRVLSDNRPYLTNNIYELDLIRRHWTKLQVKGDVPSPRYFHSMCPLGDTKLICYGGMSPSSNQTRPGPVPPNSDPNSEMAVMSDIHVFDAPTRVWTHIAITETPPGRYAHCAAVLPSTAIFTSANAPLAAILHNAPSSNPHQGTLGLSIDSSGGAEMIIVGGQDSNNKYIDAVSVFNLRSLKWTDTQSLPRSCGAYRSVVTPLTGLSPLKIGTSATDQEDLPDGVNGTTEKAEPTTSILIYSNYNFLDVKLELQVRMPNGSLVEKAMKGVVSPPGLRFPNGDVFANHFIVSGTYLTSSKHEYALWALDLRTLEWSRIDAGGGIFSQGSWNRGILWARRNRFVILGDRKRSLVDDYNHRRINFSNICMVDLEAFGLYNNPRRTWPTSDYASSSAPVLPPSMSYRSFNAGGQPLSSAAVELGALAMNIRDLADMEFVAISGEKIPVNSYVLSRRWGPYFIKLLRDSYHDNANRGSTLHGDAASSSDRGTLRPSNPSTAAASLASRNSSVTITPSINTTAPSIAPSSITAVSSNSGSTLTPAHQATTYEPPTPQNLPAPLRPRQLYFPHTLLTLRALVHYLYTSSLPSPNHHLCTPQILCSLLQLARPYRIDGLIEATIERLHQILDGRNSAALFNAAAMGAGGGRGTGTPFGKEGDELYDDVMAGAGVRTLTPGITATTAGLTRVQLQQQQQRPPPDTSAPNSGSETDTSASDLSSEGTSVSGESGSEASDISASAAMRKKDRQQHRAGRRLGEEQPIWNGGISSIVGLQKRGLRGLMEGRKIREKERSRGGGGGGGNGNGNGGSNSAAGAAVAGVRSPAGLVNGVNGVGLGIG